MLRLVVSAERWLADISSLENELKLEIEWEI